MAPSSQLHPCRGACAAGAEAVEPDPPDSQLPGHLVGHLRSGLDGGDPVAGRQALLLLWSAQHLDSLRRAEPDLVTAAARVAARRRGRSPG